MDQWNDNGEGGGYFGESGIPAQHGTKSAARQHFLCPVTVKQVLEASEDGLKVGNLTATMVSLTGIINGIETTSTNVKFSLTDDTGAIDCIEWLELEDQGPIKNAMSLSENNYYHVYGCIKSFQGKQRIMVFKTLKITDYNEISAFILEVLSINEYAQRVNKMPKQTNLPVADVNSLSSSFYNSAYDNRTAFTPVQRAVLDAIKSVGTQVGWSKYDPEFRNVYSAKQIQDALDFLVGEGHIYTTVDDDHFCST